MKTRMDCATVVVLANASGTRKVMAKFRVGVQVLAVPTFQSAPVTLQLQVIPLL